MEETNLPEARLKMKGQGQHFNNSYADACLQGMAGSRIDSAMPDRNPPRPDIRKMNIGSDRSLFSAPPIFHSPIQQQGRYASALAAGCRCGEAHPAHAETSTMVAEHTGSRHRTLYAFGDFPTRLWCLI
jgi:NADP-dependent aldehyde dehydrogenase